MDSWQTNKIEVKIYSLEVESTILKDGASFGMIKPLKKFVVHKPTCEKNVVALPGYIYIPRTQLTSIFEGQPSKTRPKLQSKQGSFGF